MKRTKQESRKSWGMYAARLIRKKRLINARGPARGMRGWRDAFVPDSGPGVGRMRSCRGVVGPSVCERKRRKNMWLLGGEWSVTFVSREV